VSTKPRFAGTTNYLTVTTATYAPAGGTEIIFPSSHLRLFNKQAYWASIHKSQKIDALCNDLDFNIGAGALVSTITVAQYRNGNLAATVEDAMNATAATTDITCTYDSTTKLYTIAKGAGTLQLLCATGANKQTTIFHALGYDTVSNKTGALTYAGSYAVKSTFGRFEITASNKVFKFNIGALTLTATLGEATYGGWAALAAELKYQLDTAATVTDFDVSFSESTLQWTIKKAAGTFEIISASNTLMTTLGYTATDKTGALTYTGTNRAIHTSERFTIDRVTATPGEMPLLVAYSNLSSAGALRFQANAADTWSGPPTFDEPITYNAYIYKHYAATPANTNLRYFSFSIVDPTNADGYVHLAGCFGGPYFSTSRNILRDTLYGTETDEIVSFADDKTPFGSLRSNLRVREIEFKDLNTTDFANLEALFDACGTRKAIVMDLDFDRLPTSEYEAGLFYMNGRPEFPERGIMDRYNMTRVRLRQQKNAA